MVGPLDSQIVINQSTAAEKIQEVQQRHPDSQQKQFAHQLQEEQEQKQQDVRDAETLDQVNIRDRQQGEETRKKRKRPRGKQKRKDGTSLRDQQGDEEEGRRVDIFV
jgi:hypothetical protein